MEKQYASAQDDDETIRERDCYHDWADKLAAAIAEFTGADIGEHSSVNNPWQNALDALGEIDPKQSASCCGCQPDKCTGEAPNKLCHFVQHRQAASVPTNEYPHDEMDAIALSRFKVEQTDSNIWGWCVRAGDGTQELYKGRKSDCEAVARRLIGAFLDGAMLAHDMLATAPQQQAASVPAYYVCKPGTADEQFVAPEAVNGFCGDCTPLYAAQPNESLDAKLGRIAMRFVDRAGDIDPNCDPAERICAEFYKAMSDAIPAPEAPKS